MVPFNVCGYPQISPFALLPMYNNILFPVSPYFEAYHQKTEKTEFVKIKDVKTFRSVHGLSPEELAYLAERGRIIPYFGSEYVKYDEGLIKHLVQPGVPRLSRNVVVGLENVVTALVTLTLREGLKNYENLARKDMVEIFKISDTKTIDVCGHCLATLYAQGIRDIITKSGLRSLPYLCLCVKPLSLSQALDTVLQTECKWTAEIIANWSGLPPEMPLESIMHGLKVTYSRDIPLEYYLDILDTKTTLAVRSVVGKLLEDPLAMKYSERLSGKIFEFNQQIEELCKSRMVKLFSLVSDIVVYGGSKFVEYESQKMMKMPKRGLQKLTEWIASKGEDLYAKMKGKDWAIAQLSKARCRIDKCTKESLNEDMS